MSAEDLITISEISRKDFGTLCICAIRYCLGRKTYMPSNVQRIVQSNLKHLSDKDLQVICDDIKKHGGPKYDATAYGDYEDYQDWRHFLHTIESEIEKREKYNER